MSSTEEYGRLEVVLDRSWEVQPVTWSNLTWWDPIPCGAELLASIRSPDPLPFPSPALSVMGHPPTPRRKLEPRNLNFRSTSASPSPIPQRGYKDYRGGLHTRYSKCDFASYSSSPLACPLPPSPDSQSFNSVFLPESSPPYQSDKTPLSVSPSPHYHCSSPLSLYPTPDSNQRPTPAPAPRDVTRRTGYRFSFSKCPPVTLPTSGQYYSQSAIMTPPSLNSSEGYVGSNTGVNRNLSLGTLPSGPNHSYY